MDQSAVNQEAKVNWEYQLAMSQEGEVKLDDEKSLLIYIFPHWEISVLKTIYLKTRQMTR